MTQEEKELLMVDLCARLPYGVKVRTGGVAKTVESITIKSDYIEIVIKGTYAYCHFIYKDTGEWDKDNDLSKCKPYLRPLSSITEEEKEEIKPLFSKLIGEFGKRVLVVEQNKMALYQDWLNRHHFDYRGLIKKSLAIEAPKDMYKTE